MPVICSAGPMKAVQATAPMAVQQSEDGASTHPGRVGFLLGERLQFELVRPQHFDRAIGHHPRHVEALREVR